MVASFEKTRPRFTAKVVLVVLVVVICPRDPSHCSSWQLCGKFYAHPEWALCAVPLIWYLRVETPAVDEGKERRVYNLLYVRGSFGL